MISLHKAGEGSVSLQLGRGPLVKASKVIILLLGTYSKKIIKDVHKAQAPKC